MSRKADRTKSKNRNILVKLACFFVTKWRVGLAIWLTILISGGFIYTSVIQREGFPPISFPLSIVSGTYFVDDANLVDQTLTQPISDALSTVNSVKKVSATSGANYFSVAVEFDESVSSDEGTALVEAQVGEIQSLPKLAQISYLAIEPGSFMYQYNLLVNVYSESGLPAKVLDQAAADVAVLLNQSEVVSEADVSNNVVLSIDPKTSQPGEFKTTFSRLGLATANGLEYFDSTVIGVSGTADVDVIELSQRVNEVLGQIDLSAYGDDLHAVIGADFASDIDQQINSLQSNMLSGLIAVALISFLLISWRASIITALFMLSVMSLTIVVLYLIGYTLNTIVLFALILSLGLFVDDATIMVEAIDVSKRLKKLSKLEMITRSVKKVGAASLSGTLTTVLVFAILATPSGILGRFIRLIPITVIIALLLSFILSMTIIPLLSRFIILGDKKISWVTKHNPILKCETLLSSKLRANILQIRSGKGKLKALLALGFSTVLIISGLYMFGAKVDQNTFPSSKDSDQIAIQLNFAPGLSIEHAENTAAEAETIVNDNIGEFLKHGIYGAQQISTSRSAVLNLELTHYSGRDIKSPVLVEKLQSSFDSLDNFPARVVVGSVDNGPPSDQFPFGIRVFSSDKEITTKALSTFEAALNGQELTAFNGEQIKILESKIEGLGGTLLSEDGKAYSEIKFAFDSENPTLSSSLAELRFEELFPSGELEGLRLSADQVKFDQGQEGDFQESFKSLLIAIPIAILLMYALLIVQFKSIVQPFLILLAIPFTLFGVAFGLYMTNNSASFFALVGFIGLIGIAVNNTIMLTDYANQERRQGKGPIEAIANAASERLRPLIATSLTTVVALLPLALSDPFWESLAVTIIFGLLSSTLLVIVSFPYYYLIVEYLRQRSRRLFVRSRRL